MRRTMTAALTAGAILLGLVCAPAADARALTPWTNRFDIGVVAAGWHYTIHWTGTGKHVYDERRFWGCAPDFAKHYLVTVHPDGAPDRVLLRRVVDAAHYLAGTDQHFTRTMRYRSVSSLLRAVEREVERSDADAEWIAGGKHLAEARLVALGTDAQQEGMERIGGYLQRRSIVDGQDATGSVDMSGLDLAARMRSTKQYGSGCITSSQGSDQARFARSVSLTGTGLDFVFTETDVTDGVTIGFDQARYVAKQTPWFLETPTGRRWFRNPLAAATSAEVTAAGAQRS